MARRLQQRRVRVPLAAVVLACAGACGGVRSCAAPPPLPAGRFLYVVHDPPAPHPAPGAEPRIAAFRIEPESGVLQAVAEGTLEARAVGAFALQGDAQGRWFALAGSQLGLQRVTASGALERVGPAGAGLSTAFDPKGRFFYLSTGRGLSVHPLDERQGPDVDKTLHLETGVIAFQLRPSVDGRTLYATVDGGLRAYVVSDRGLLAGATDPTDVGVRGLDLIVHPSGRFLLVPGEVKGDRRVAVLRVDGTSVEPVEGSPFDVGAGVHAVALSADGAHLFVADRDRHTIETFGLDAGGGLHNVGSTPVTADRIDHLCPDADGRVLYATARDDAGVYAWTIEDDGTLEPVPGAPFKVGGHAGELRVTPRREGPLVAAALPEASSFGEAAPRLAVGAPPPAGTTLFALGEKLGDPSDETRYAAILAIEQRRDIEPVLSPLIAALDDPMAGVRLRARLLIGPYALTHPGKIDDEVLGRLVAGANGRGVVLDNASLTALHALKKRGPDAAPYLARAIVNSGQLRQEAMGALVAMGPAAAPAVPELRQLLQDSQANRHAAYVLGCIGPAARDALPELEALVDHPSRPVASTAEAAIARIRGVR
jgi:sugar lactone lactonase YvrE